MGWTPADLRAASVTEYRAALEGWIRSKTGSTYTSPETIEDGLALARKHRWKEARRKAALTSK